MNDVDDWVEKVFAAGGDRETLDRLYDEWAKDYDQHLWSSGNPYISVASGMAGRHIPDFGACILDAGCGTGNMGQILHQMGFRNLEGLDPSSGMLEMARRKGFYRCLHQTTLGAQVDLEAERYDVAVALGVLTVGHAPPESLDGLLSLLKPDGMLIFSLTEEAFESLGFKEKMHALDEDKRWTRVERSNLFHAYPFSEREAHVRLWIHVCRKLEVGM